MRLKADLTLFLISITWGSSFVAQRVGGQIGSVYLFNGARYLLAELVILSFVGRENLSSIPRNQYKWMAIAGFLLFVVFSEAFHVVVLEKFASRFEPMSFSMGQLVVCGLLSLGVGFAVESGLVLNWQIVFAIIFTAVFSPGLCYTLQVWAQRHTPAADAALILSLEAVFAVVCGWLLLGERLSAIQFTGCGLIFVAVLLSQIKEWTSGTIDHDHLAEGR